MKVASLFSGCGGLDLGFQQAGHEIVFAIDNDQACYETYIANISEAIVCRNIDSVSLLPECDIIIGGPPCQQFSVAARGRKRKHPKDFVSILQFARVIVLNQPQYFLMENVLGLLYQPHLDLLMEFINRMETAGYNILLRKLDAADYGVPQHRKRVFIYGSLTNNPPPPKQTHSFGLFGKPYITTSDALGWKETKLLSQNRSTWRMLKAGKGYFYYSDRPARTVTTRGHSICLPLPSRLMTVRESAILQSFPDNFEFSGNVESQRKQIGNAVPPLMALRIAVEMF
ncbi:MAG: DNA cytosine methyltransferase [Planctomycetota bacterium]|jgi:DNA (cytosine-5)-methyltransferase 1